MSQFTPTSPAVSVLMAAQDAEKTVRRAVESLQNQTLRNFELVVVDRGSHDATPRILDALAERDMRLSVVRAEDCGRQEALNLALDRAKGEYVLIMDADGWAEPSMLASLLEPAHQGALELAVGGLALSVAVASGRTTELEMAAESHVYATQHDFRAAAWELFASGQLLPASGKLFLRARLEGESIRFDEASGTDHSFVVDFLRGAERVGVVGGVCYHVARRFGEGTRATAGAEGYRRLEAEHAALLDLYRQWGLEGDAASMEMLQSRYLEQLAGCVEGVCGWGSAVPSSEQRRVVASMIGTERAQLAASVARPRGNSARAMQAPIKAGNVALACVQARLMSLLRRGGVVEVVPDAFV